MKFVKMAALAATFAAVPMAANAQDKGVTIYSPDDSVVGTVIDKNDRRAVVDTGSYKVPLPLKSFADNNGKWVIGATKEQLDSMMAARAAKAEAALNAVLVVGAPLISRDAQPAGSILAIDTEADQVIVERGTGVLSLKRKHFRAKGDQLMTVYKLEQIAAATKEVPEGAEIRTASGTLVRGGAGSETAAATGDVAAGADN